jgi:ubiquinone/menaquinone biosynthesis C-methylase UbiE
MCRRSRAARAALDNIEFHIGDMEKLDCPDGHFDAVVRVFAVFFVPDTEKRVGEPWRMVRSGGKLAITSLAPASSSP